MDAMTCIYCLHNEQPSAEHVIPKGLGGNLTISCVCEECNRGTSELDQSLCDSSLLTLVRVVEQPNTILGSSLVKTTTEQNNEILEMCLGYMFKPKTKPQLIFNHVKEGTYAIQAVAADIEDLRKFFEVLRKYQSKNKLRSIKILASLSNKVESIGDRIVLNRGKQIVFRPSRKDIDCSEEYTKIMNLVDQKLDHIESSIMQVAQQAKSVKTDNPSIQIGSTIDFGRNLRAVSKIALNFIAHAFGPELLLSDVFDGMRSYILHGEGSDESSSLWDVGSGEERSMSATRYAIWMQEYRCGSYGSGRPNVHRIILTWLKGHHVAIIEFYGQVAFSVDLGVMEIPAHHLLPVIHEFDYVNRSNWRVDIIKVARRLANNMKNAGGHDS